MTREMPFQGYRRRRAWQTMVTLATTVTGHLRDLGRPAFLDGSQNAADGLSRLADNRSTRSRRMVPEHDPEKWIPIFGKDHAPTMG
jgi:hypothetical protein